MAADVLEGVQASIAGGHQLDDTDSGMRRMPRRLVEFAPAPVVGFDFVGERLDEPRGSHPGHELLDALDSNVVNHDRFPFRQLKRC